MKGKVNKIICSVMPFWVEHLYVKGRYNLNRFPAAVKVLLMVLPSVFVYIVSNHNANDKRLMKYWLPYGLMRDRMLKTYGKRIETGHHSKFARLFRWILPYGYVLWWDNPSRYNEPVKAQETVAAGAFDSEALSKIDEQINDFRAACTRNQMRQLELTERMEVELLKLAVEMKKHF